MHLMRAGTLNLSSLPPLGLYIHLPWCISKCPYCDFNSHALRSDIAARDPLSTDDHKGLETNTQERYTQALLRDLERALPLIWGRPVHTVFFGGGTPSLFDPDVIGRLLSRIRSLVTLLPGCEVTLEANPGSFERERFKAFRDAGITRLSLGVQSFNDDALKALGRVHNKAQALEAASEASQVFETYNLDLMYALPGQSVQDLVKDLETALSFSPPHLSVYHLTLEPNTVFAKYPPKHLPCEDTAYDMLDVITALANRSGLARYEVSVFAAPGERCQHNLNYWQFGDYLGIGAGAHSKLSFAHRVVRQTRFKEPGLYMSRSELSGTLGGVAESIEIRRADLPFEFMLNLTRLREGFALQLFSERTGMPVSAVDSALQEALAKGLIHQGLNEHGVMQVTPTAKGFDFLNDLQALFLPN